MRRWLNRFRVKLRKRHVVAIFVLCVAILYSSLFLVTRHHFLVTRFDRSRSDGLYVCPWLHVHFFSKNGSPPFVLVGG